MLKNVFSNWVLLAATVLSTFVILPFNIHHLGKSQYGVWLIITSITSIIPLLYNGVPMAIERFLARAIAQDARSDTDRLMSTAVVIMGCIAALSAIIATMAYIFLSGTSLAGFSTSQDARFALLIGLLNGVAFVLHVPPHIILAANQQFVISNAVALALLVVRLALNVGFVLWQATVTSLAIAFLIATLIESVVLFILIMVLHPDIRIRLSLFSGEVVRRIAALAAWTFVLGIGWQFSFQIDALVIGTFMAKADVTTFGVANALMLYLLNFMVGVAIVAMPLASSLHANHRFDELRDVFIKWSKITVMLSWVACAFLFVFGSDFISIWLGKELGAPAGRVLMILIVSYTIFLPMRGMALPLLIGVGKAGWTTTTVVLVGLLNLALSLALVGPLGLDGVAIGTTIPNIILAMVLLYLICQELELSIADYLWEVFARPILGLAAAILGMYGLRSLIMPTSFPELFVAGVLSVAIYAAVWGLFVLRKDRHLDINELARFMPPALKRRFC